MRAWKSTSSSASGRSRRSSMKPGARSPMSELWPRTTMRLPIWVRPSRRGSFVTEGMVIVPCSMRSVAAVAHGTSENLLHRAADVALKERRRLVIVPRETPLSPVHLENLLKLARMGVTILPPMPAFYNHPESIADLVDHAVARMLDQFWPCRLLRQAMGGHPKGGPQSPASEVRDLTRQRRRQTIVRPPSMTMFWPVM